LLARRGIEVDERDIIRDPPTRGFLEQHIGNENFLDFVSRRSPVFKERPLPRTKREAIDLMMKQPNLIKRPILVTGRRAVFGFDKEAYDRIGENA
jgi:arsenate reductase-like glutaredoxin family protein